MCGRDEGFSGPNAHTVLEGELLDLFPDWSPTQPRPSVTRFAQCIDDPIGGLRRHMTTLLEHLCKHTAAGRVERCSRTVLQI